MAHQAGIGVTVHGVHQADAAHVKDPCVGDGREISLIDNKAPGGALHVQGRTRAIRPCGDDGG